MNYAIGLGFITQDNDVRLMVYDQQPHKTGKCKDSHSPLAAWQKSDIDESEYVTRLSVFG